MILLCYLFFDCFQLVLDLDHIITIIQLIQFVVDNGHSPFTPTATVKSGLFLCRNLLYSSFLKVKLFGLMVYQPLMVI